jgi:hypothetical protein
MCSGKTIVWVAVIEHKHGRNVYVANSHDGVEEHIAAFCREAWGAIFTEHLNPPPDEDERSAEDYEKAYGRKAMIERYFEVENATGGIENAEVFQETLEVESCPTT